MQILLYGLALALIVATVVPLLRRSEWWIRGFDFPRAQIAVLGVVTLVAFAWARRPFTGLDLTVLSLLLMTVLYQGYRMFPYTPLAPKQVRSISQPDPDARLSVLIANVFMDNEQEDRLLTLVRGHDPDVILTVETNRRWQEALRPLEEDYPYRLAHPLDNTYGMLFYSRLPLVDPELRFLVQEDIPSIRTHIQLRDGQEVRFYGLHPRPPGPTEAEDTSERDAELLIVAREAADYEGPLVVTGDLNDVAWSSTTSLMQRISGLLDPRIGRGLYSSFHAKIPLLRWPLDHVFHSDHFYLASLQRLDAFGSDHFPIYFTLSLEPQAPRQQEEPEPDAEDEERADEIIDEGTEP